MANSPTTTTEPKKPSRVRKAFEEAQRRVPVEWSLDEAHELLVKWAGSTVKVKAHRGIVQDWLREQLSTAYGKAALGALLASPIGVPLLAHVVGKGDALADKIADEFAARAMTIGGVQLARDVVRKLPKGLYNFALGLFDRFENTEMPQLTAQASRGGMEDIEKAAQTQAMRNG